MLFESYFGNMFLNHSHYGWNESHSLNDPKVKKAVGVDITVELLDHTVDSSVASIVNAEILTSGNLCLSLKDGDGIKNSEVHKAVTKQFYRDMGTDKLESLIGQVVTLFMDWPLGIRGYAVLGIVSRNVDFDKSKLLEQSKKAYGEKLIQQRVNRPRSCDIGSIGL